MKIERRKFLQIGSSAGLGVLFAGGTSYGVWTAIRHPERLFHDSRIVNDKQGEMDSAARTPYRQTHAFEVDKDILAFEIYRGMIVLATNNAVHFFGISGEEQLSFPIPEGARDLTIFNELVYLLFPTAIEVRSTAGELIRRWEACNDDADYCQMAVSEGGVFVTDASNKNICQYDLDGHLLRFIQSPQGFVIPSYSFAITAHDGLIYCSNSGRHLIETYDYDGNFVASFGKIGRKPGSFCGCCNPVYLDFTATGEILTSEKGLPRICCYGTDGTFRSLLLDSKALGSQHQACEMHIAGDKLIVANGKAIKVFRYKKENTGDSPCASCEKNCPLKSGAPI